MTVQYTIQLTDAQNKALRYDVASAQDWIENVVQEKCRIVMEDIVAQEVNRITANGGTLSGTKEDIVLAAPIVLASDRMAQSGNQV
jgi:hypothetical protein